MTLLKIGLKLIQLLRNVKRKVLAAEYFPDTDAILSNGGFDKIHVRLLEGLNALPG